MSGVSHSTDGRTSFSYYLPCGMTVTYSGERQSYWRWLADTWGAGVAIWSIWLRVAWGFVVQGYLPRPSLVTAATLRIMCAFLGRAT